MHSREQEYRDGRVSVALQEGAVWADDLFLRQITWKDQTLPCTVLFQYLCCNPELFLFSHSSLFCATFIKMWAPFVDWKNRPFSSAEVVSGVLCPRKLWYALLKDFFYWFLISSTFFPLFPSLPISSLLQTFPKLLMIPIYSGYFIFSTSHAD